MKPGHIDQFSHLSPFSSVKDFNESIKRARKQYEHHFTKGERIALLTLIQFSVKKYGVCNARVAKLVQATQAKNGKISRSTFERMLRKAKALGILSIHHTIRQKGGYSHNVYVFQRFDESQDAQMTKRQPVTKPATPSLQVQEKAPEAPSFQTKKQKHIKELRQPTLDSLDHTFVPSYVPTSFVKAAKPFFNRAKDICSLWDKALIAHRSMKFHQSIDLFLPTIIQAFKETVYKYKQSYIRTSFIQYFYGTVAGKLAVEKRRIMAEDMAWGGWLVRN